MNRIGRMLGGAALLAVFAVPSTADAHTTVPVTRNGTVVRVVRRAPRTCRWIPPHREIRHRAVVVRAGYWRETVHPERVRYAFDLHRCRLVKVVVSPRRVERTWVPAVIENRREVVTVPGRWERRGHAHGHVHHGTHRPVVRIAGHSHR